MAGLIPPPDPFSASGMQIGENANPYAADRSGALGPNLADMAALGESMVPRTSYAAPRLQRGPAIAFSPSSRKLFVNGMTFDADDAQSALDSEQLLSQPATELPAGDWQPLDEEAYGQFLASIKNPSMRRLAKKNFGRGVDVSQMLAGRALQFAGAEDTGQGIVANQLESLRKTGPFERQFTDIGSQENRGVLDWFVANLAQQGPNIVESAVTALLGAGAGSLAGGGANPFSAAGGALMALSGKQAFKQSVLAAAKKHAAGETLSAAENKLLREAAGITAAAQVKHGVMYQGAEGVMDAGAFAGREAGRVTTELLQATPGIRKAGLTQARVGGAAAASLGQNYGTGVADLYGESIESGDPDRAAAAKLGIPYAALETMPEFLLAGRIFGGAGKGMFGTKPLAGMSLADKGIELGKRAALGGTVGGLSEGSTEAGQEGLLLGINEDVDWDSPEGMHRLINSFAAGFGVGGPIGTAGGMFPGGDRTAPVNLLDNTKPTEPTPSPDPGYQRGPASPAQTPNLPLLGGPAAAPLTGQYIPAGTNLPTVPGAPPPVSAAPGQLPTLPTGPGTMLTGEGVMPTGPGTQGVLPLFESMPADEMAGRMQPPASAASLPPPSAAPVANPAQGALQFAPAAPGPTTGFGDTIAAAIAAEQRLQQVGEAQGQRAQTDTTQKLTTDYDRALMQREQQDARQPLENMPMVDVRRPQPGQMSLPLRLFRRGQQPVMSAAERLRRGTAPAPAAEVDLEPTGNVQLEMFDSKLNPTVAALKGAGKTQRVKPVSDPQTQQAPPTGNKVTPLSVAVARKKEAAKSASDRGLKKQAGVKSEGKVDVQERSPEKVAPSKQARAGGEVVSGGVKVEPAAAAAGTSLRKGNEPAAKADAGDKKLTVRQKQADQAKVTREEPPPPKSEAAAADRSGAAATPAQPEVKGPTPIKVELDGQMVEAPDGEKLLKSIDDRIEKFESLLACLTG